ncbi:MAG: DNA polymerase III subunit gamma/tau [Microthrixaceae bacterium]
MTYQSLYRRFRPSRFAEVRGQDHITGAVRNAVRTDSVGHAYMFSGPRGCGKTSTARILGKALNCTNLDDGEPCGTCESCVAMEAGTSYDLHELDAASNNGVDAMRDLVSRAALGTAGRTKVYILDEVHMLSPAASNALLKTLEEPPPHVTFVLATTDPQKVLPTIKSRTQHFIFELLSPHELEDYVRWVIAEADLSVDDDAIAYVVRQGRGSARDTLSALDQVVAGGGVVPRQEPSAEVVDALINRDTGAALAAVAHALGSGSDPRVLGEALVADLRDLFLLTMGVDGANVADADREALTERARTAGPARLTRALEQLGTALVDMRQASDPRVPLEVALVRLTSPEADLSVEALAERVESLERALAGGAATAPSAATATTAAARSTERTPSPTEAAPSPASVESAPGPASDAAPPGAAAQGGGQADEPAAQASGPSDPRSKMEEARAMLRAKTGREAPPAEPIDAVPASEAPPPTPRRRRPRPPAEGGAAGATEAPPSPAPDSAAAAGPAPMAEPEPPPRAVADAPSPSAAPAAPEPEPAPAGAPADTGTASEANELNAALETVLGQLKPVARALFVGRFAPSADGSVEFHLDNPAIADRATARQQEFVQQLSATVGRPVQFKVVAGPGGAAAGREPSGRHGRTSHDGSPAPRGAVDTDDSEWAPDEEEDYAALDMDELEDADPPLSAAKRLLEAFPGAELITPDDT